MERRNLRVAVSDIDVGPRLRKIDMDWARWIASSMKDLDAANPGYGQQTPIEVRPGGLEKGRYTLTAGAHRLEAVKINGWTEIEVAVVEVKDLEAELREIDENLFRRDLGALDRATFLARRQEVFWELHPETKRGTAGANARWNAADNLSFASQVALKLGVTPRDVRRSITTPDRRSWTASSIDPRRVTSNRAGRPSKVTPKLRPSILPPNAVRWR